ASRPRPACPTRRSSDLVSLSELTQRVTHSALQALPHHKRINVSISPVNLEITPDQAHHLALIVNEVVTNCVKYSLGDRPNGQLRSEEHTSELQSRENLV